jgi:hypothetical protein
MVQRGTGCGRRAWLRVFPAAAGSRGDYIGTDIDKWLQPRRRLAYSQSNVEELKRNPVGMVMRHATVRESQRSAPGLVNYRNSCKSLTSVTQRPG